MPLMDTDSAAVRHEACIQAQTLARIVMAKYACFSKALTAGLIAVLCSWDGCLPYQGPCAYSAAQLSKLQPTRLAASRYCFAASP
jgi:hypothetical protein